MLRHQPAVSPETSEDACEVQGTHPEAVARALAARAPDADMDAVADIFQLLASPTRLRILEALAPGR